MLFKFYNFQKLIILLMAGAGGLEPQLTVSKTVILPLNYAPKMHKDDLVSPKIYTNKLSNSQILVFR